MPPAVLGSQRPRIWCTPPARSSAGREAVALARHAGLVLDDWEAWVLEQSLGEGPAGKWAAFEVGLIVSRQNGKGAILEARELAGLFLFGERLIIHTAHEFKTAQEAFLRIRALVEGTPSLRRRVKKIPESHGEEGIELISGQRLRFIARSGGSGRGFTADLLIYDEAMFLDAADVGASLPTLSSRPNPQVWYTGSAGLKVNGRAVSTQLARVRRRGLLGTDKALCFAEWSIDPHTDQCGPACQAHDNPEDVKSWARANPALGIRISVEHVARELDAMEPATFANERLGVGVYPASADDWSVIPKKWWDATMLTDRHRPDRPVFGVDATPERTATAIAMAGARPDKRVQIELADHRAGMGWAVDRMTELDRRWNPQTWVVDAHSAAGSLIEAMTQAGLDVLTPNATEVAHACGQIYDAFHDDQLRHSGDRAVARALAGADTRNLSAQWAWNRRTHTVDLSPLVAFTLAHWGHLKLAAEQDYDAMRSVHLDATEIIRLWSLGVYGPADITRLCQSGVIASVSFPKLAAAGIPIPAGLED